MKYQVIYRKATGTEWRNFGALKTRIEAFSLATIFKSQFPKWEVTIRFLG